MHFEGLLDLAFVAPRTMCSSLLLLLPVLPHTLFETATHTALAAPAIVTLLLTTAAAAAAALTAGCFCCVAHELSLQ